LSYDVLRKPVPTFGDKFRKAREGKKLSLDDVSRVTKIGARMLQAIEEEHFDLLPGGVFNKGFIRAYAKHLGLNDEEAVTDYLTCLRQAQVDANQFREPAPAPVRNPAPPKATPSATPKPTPPKPALKSRAAVEEEELSSLQLPRVEDVRPPARSFPAKRESFPRITALLFLIAILAVALFWTRRSHTTHHQAEAASAAPPITQPASMSLHRSPHRRRTLHHRCLQLPVILPRRV
jgi:cytoskeletal protein RodZ